MNAAFHQVIGAKDDERLELFLASARRLGTAVQNIEKDFWVCWVLDILFNRMGGGHPRLLFKGGTSLSMPLLHSVPDPFRRRPPGTCERRERTGSRAWGR